MQVFMSWSGDRSKAVAEVMNSWLKCVLQTLRPWMSTHDLAQGSLWMSEINEALKDVSTGIVFLTQENKEKPWILFESGAMLKGLSTNRVCTVLIDLKPHEVTGPLAQFNHTEFTKDAIHGLVATINSRLAVGQLDQKTLARVFETYWPQLDTDFQDAIKATPETKAKPRKSDDMLAEILQVTRELTQRVGSIESRQNLSALYSPPEHSHSDSQRGRTKPLSSGKELQDFLTMTIRQFNKRIMDVEEAAHRLKSESEIEAEINGENDGR